MVINMKHIRFVGIFSNTLQAKFARNLKMNELNILETLYRRISSSKVAQKNIETDYNKNQQLSKSKCLASIYPIAFKNPYYLRKFSSSYTYKSQQQRKQDDIHELVESSEQQQEKSPVTVTEKVKQAGKDASYMGVLIIGFGVTGVLIWYIVSELLFSFSPNSVYTKALKEVKANDLVAEAVGLPMKAYGEETSRGRRRHVSHQEYVVNGVNFMRVKFYVAGNKRKGIVHVDTKETSRGKFDFRYIFVELDGYPTETIIVLDNR